jgi:hypothetical protein
VCLTDLLGIRVHGFGKANRLSEGHKQKDNQSDRQTARGSEISVSHGFRFCFSRYADRMSARLRKPVVWSTGSVAVVRLLVEPDLFAKAELSGAPFLAPLVAPAPAHMAAGVTAILAEMAVRAGVLPARSSPPASRVVHPVQTGQLNKTQFTLTRLALHGLRSSPCGSSMDALRHDFFHSFSEQKIRSRWCQAK